MICTKCGFNCAPGTKFCEKCGASLEAPQQAPQQAYQQQPYQQQAYQQQAYQQQPYQQAYQQPYQQKAPSVPGKGFGIASMVCGIVSLVLFCIWYLAIPCAIVSVALGFVGYNKAKQAGMKNGMATAGIVCSVIALAITLIFCLLILLGVASMSML